LGGFHYTAEIADEVFSRSARGALGIDLALYAQKKGFQSDFYRGNTEDLRRQIDSGRPVIVLVDYGFWVYEKGHFMVVIGYNDDGFIVNTGASRMKFIAMTISPVRGGKPASGLWSYAHDSA
jgi:hypothetical protein